MSRGTSVPRSELPDKRHEAVTLAAVATDVNSIEP